MCVIMYLFQVNGHMDYMKKMPTVLEAVGIKTKDVHNVFIPHSDSGYSTKTTNSCVNDGMIT